MFTVAFFKDLIKDNVPAPTPKEETSKYGNLYKYLSDCLSTHGHTLDTFADRVRICFVEAQCHHARIKYATAIATRTGLNMYVPSDRIALWEMLAREYVISRKEQARWASEGLDRPLNPVLTYANKVACTSPEVSLPRIDDSTEMVQSGIARTLTFIRVFPPKLTAAPLDGAEHIVVIKRCWEMLQDHPSYKCHKHWMLSQHALDLVQDDPEFRQHLWIDPTELGELKQWIEGNGNDVSARLRPMLFSWLMFKYSTFLRIQNNNYQGPNPHNWIWDDALPSHCKLWRWSNG